MNKIQSSTLRSYISAIKYTLKCDNYEWDDQKVWLDALIRSCKLANDHLTPRFPIHYKLLELLLFELQRIFNQQPYLESLYKGIYCLSYYGLMRISEIADGPHALKAKDVYVGQNKNKIRIVLYSSKTHDKSKRPQEIKISAETKTQKRFFCRFTLLRSYMAKRGSFRNTHENFFVFTDGSPVKQHQIRTVLRKYLLNLRLNADCYNLQSFRIG